MVMAGGDDGLPLRQVGPQWLWRRLALKLMGAIFQEICCSLLLCVGVALTPIQPMLPNHSRGALCSSVETFTDAPVKGMAIIQSGVVGGEGGEMLETEMVALSVHCPLLFVAVFRQGINVFPPEQTILKITGPPIDVIALALAPACFCLKDVGWTMNE